MPEPYSEEFTQRARAILLSVFQEKATDGVTIKNVTDEYRRQGLLEGISPDTQVAAIGYPCDEAKETYTLGVVQWTLGHLNAPLLFDVNNYNAKSTPITDKWGKVTQVFPEFVYTKNKRTFVENPSFASTLDTMAIVNLYHNLRRFFDFKPTRWGWISCQSGTFRLFNALKEGSLPQFDVVLFKNGWFNGLLNCNNNEHNGNLGDFKGSFKAWCQKNLGYAPNSLGKTLETNNPFLDIQKERIPKKCLPRQFFLASNDTDEMDITDFTEFSRLLQSKGLKVETKRYPDDDSGLRMVSAQADLMRALEQGSSLQYVPQFEESRRNTPPPVQPSPADDKRKKQTATPH